MTLRKNVQTHWLAVALGILLLLVYLYNLAGWQILDDEGAYLYQIWRMQLGERPYRDFMTPQLPAFLYGGSAVMALFGSSLWVMRAYNVLLAFGSAGLLYALAQKQRGLLAGLLTLLLFLLHAEVFRETRFFRNEPVFLAGVTAGLVLATWHGTPRLRHLQGASVAFAVATLAKLFGLLPAGGVGLWLIGDALWQKRPFSQFLRQAWSLSWPLLLILGSVGLGFSLFTPHFFDLVLIHHLAQGAEKSTVVVFSEKLALFGRYFQLYPLLLSTAFLSLVAGWRDKDLRLVLAWQLPTVLAFLFLSRGFERRHFMYLIPTISLLAGWLLADGLNGRYRLAGRLVALLALLGILTPVVRQNWGQLTLRDSETAQLVALIQQHTEPNDHILADDVGLAFYAQRPTTYTGAALSQGASSSGQITGELLIGEMVEKDVRLVVVDQSWRSHLTLLRDYPRFHRFLEQNYAYIGRFRRDYQQLDLWVRDGSAALLVDDNPFIAQRDGTQFGDHIQLLGYTIDQTSLQPGEPLSFTLFWAATAAATTDWKIFAHFVGPDGSLVAQHDKLPYDGAYPPTRWWPDQLVDDAFTIVVPADAPAGEYRLAVGMYDEATGERLPLTTAAGTAVPDNRVLLAQPITIGK